MKLYLEPFVVQLRWKYDALFRTVCDVFTGLEFSGYLCSKWNVQSKIASHWLVLGIHQFMIRRRKLTKFSSCIWDFFWDTARNTGNTLWKMRNVLYYSILVTVFIFLTNIIQKFWIFRFVFLIILSSFLSISIHDIILKFA